MTRIVFRDCDEFADAIQGIAGRFLPTAFSKQEWWVHFVASGRVPIQTLQIGAQVTFAGEGKRGQVALLIPLTDPTRIRIDGRSLAHGSYLLITGGQAFTISTPEVTRWIGIVVPSDHELLTSEPVQSRLASLAREGVPTVQAQAEHLDGIRLLAKRLSAAFDNISSGASVAGSAEREITAVISAALQGSRKAPPSLIGRPAVDRGQIVARVLAMIEASPGTPLFIHDLCRAAGVAERTLRNVFREYFGVGPMRFLKVRQLCEARKALLSAAPEVDTVTRIASRFGFCDMSLFASHYKALFGESPSQSLRTVAEAAQQRDASRDTWLEYAMRAAAGKARPTDF